ncbi:MAG: hypothetical protein WC135_01840 [Bacteroidales bacterium]
MSVSLTCPCQHPSHGYVSDRDMGMSASVTWVCQEIESKKEKFEAENERFRTAIY